MNDEFILTDELERQLLVVTLSTHLTAGVQLHAAKVTNEAWIEWNVEMIDILKQCYEYGERE